MPLREKGGRREYELAFIGLRKKGGKRACLLTCFERGEEGLSNLQVAAGEESGSHQDGGNGPPRKREKNEDGG